MLLINAGRFVLNACSETCVAIPEATALEAFLVIPGKAGIQSSPTTDPRLSTVDRWRANR